MKLKTSAQGKNIDKALKSIKPNMQPYTEIITNKDTIDKATHVFAPSKPKGLKVIPHGLLNNERRKNELHPLR